MKKIKIFLGAYINSSNAQNLNCLALAKYLDREKFSVAAMELYSGNILLDEEIRYKTKLFYAFKPHKISKYIAYFFGIFWADIIYLPKGELPRFTTLLIKVFRKKSFSTIEGVYDEIAQENAIKLFGSMENMKNYYACFDRIFSITKFMSEKNKELIGLSTDKNILYLGTDIELFLDKNKTIDELQNIIFIGNDLLRKGIYDYLYLAQKFPQLTFHVVGTGNGRLDLVQILEEEGLTNVVYHGGLNHTQLKELLHGTDLHILPSRSEGFPKVTLETGAAGVPSLVYSDYGADEWIKHGTDGFVVDTLDEMEEILHMLKQEPSILKNISKNSVRMARRFDWSTLIKNWEEVIEELY